MKLVLTFIVIILGAVFALAQERVIDAAEFDLALKGTDGHKTKWQGQPYRVTAETSAKIADKPDSDHSATILIEFGPARTIRTVHTSRFGGKTTTEETLLIGDSSYSKTNGGPWITAARSPEPAAGAKPNKADTPSQVSADSTYFLVGKKPYKEATATVYRKVENSTKVNAATGVESRSVCTGAYWLVDGVQRKYDLTCQHHWPTQTSTNVINTQWDLDPTIVFQRALARHSALISHGGPERCRTKGNIFQAAALHHL